MPSDSPENTPSPEPPPAPAVKRRRGAPAGNTNALTHGFYSRKFRPVDNADLDSCKHTDLTDEIVMLRVFIRRVFEHYEDTADFSESVSFLRVLSFALISLTRMLKTQKLLGNSTSDEFKAALEEVCIEMGIH